jgi:acetyl-CoA carboxylase biotin carboxyl carrier protein
MNLKDIQELIKFVAKSGATEVDLEIDNIKISIKSPEKKKRGESDEVTTIIQQPTPSVITAPVVNISPIPNTPEVVENDNYITIKSSMIGTFYRSASPENPPFINIGDNIKEGDTLCIIEAMKLFNEIESEVTGKIVKVLVDDTTPIEFDQPLFLVDPS